MVTPSGYCFTPVASLKWAETLASAVMVGLTDWGYVLVSISENNDWSFTGYYAVFVFSIICLILTFVTLLLYVCRHQHNALTSMPWAKIEIAVNILLGVLCIVILGLASAEAVEKYKRVGPDGWQGRMWNRWRDHIAAIAAFAGLNTLLYITSAIFAARGAV